MSGTSVLIISHITFQDCRVHCFSDNLSRNSCKRRLFDISLINCFPYDELQCLSKSERNAKVFMKAVGMFVPFLHVKRTDIALRFMDGVESLIPFSLLNLFARALRLSVGRGSLRLRAQISTSSYQMTRYQSMSRVPESKLWYE